LWPVSEIADRPVVFRVMVWWMHDTGPTAIVEFGVRHYETSSASASDRLCMKSAP